MPPFRPDDITFNYREFDYLICNTMFTSAPDHPFWQHLFGWLLHSYNLAGPLDVLSWLAASDANKSLSFSMATR